MKSKAWYDVPKINVGAKEVNESVSELNLTGAVMLANAYKDNVKVFIKMFVQYYAIKGVCALSVNEFEKKCSDYKEDEKISRYVDNLNLEERWSSLLKRTLVMIKTICNT